MCFVNIFVLSKLFLFVYRLVNVLQNVLQWFRSYLSDRSFRVVLDSNSSFVVHLFCSVPQGSVLGPRMFIMYTADLADFVSERQVNFHSFADNTQTYLHCLPSDVDSVVCQLGGCITRWHGSARVF